MSQKIKIEDHAKAWPIIHKEKVELAYGLHKNISKSIFVQTVCNGKKK